MDVTSCKLKCYNCRSSFFVWLCCTRNRIVDFQNSFVIIEMNHIFVVKIVIHVFSMILMICFAAFEFWLSQWLQNRFNDVNPSLPGVSFTYFLKTSEKSEKGTLGSNGLKMTEKDLGNYDSGKNIPYWWCCTFFLEIGTLFFVILETVLNLSFILKLIDCC